jgi:DNA-binding protein
VPLIDVYGKRTLEYVTDCVIKFNRDTEKVILRSVMGNTSKAIEVARILFKGLVLGLVSPCIFNADQTQQQRLTGMRISKPPSTTLA